MFGPAAALPWDLLAVLPGSGCCPRCVPPAPEPVPPAADRSRPRRVLAGARDPELARPTVNRLTATGAPSDAIVERRLTGVAVLVVAVWMLLVTRLFYLQVVQGDV